MYTLLSCHGILLLHVLSNTPKKYCLPIFVEQFVGPFFVAALVSELPAKLELFVVVPSLNLPTEVKGTEEGSQGRERECV